MEFFVDSIETVPDVDGKKAAPLACLGSVAGGLYALGGHGAMVAIFQEFFGDLISIAVPEGERGDEKACFIGRLQKTWATQPVIGQLWRFPSFARYLGLEEYLEEVPLSEMLQLLSEKVALTQVSISLGTEDVLKALRGYLSTEVVNFAHLLVLWKSGLTRAQIEACVPGFFQAYPELQNQLVANLARLDDELAAARQAFAQTFHSIAERRQSERELQAWLGASSSQG